MTFRTLFIIVFSLGLTCSLSSQGLEETIKLGDRYYESGQISEALYYYQRAAFFSPGGSSPEILIKIADCFGLMGDLERSVEYIDHAYFSGPPDSLRKEIIFKKANAFISTGNYNFALIELLGMDTNKGSLDERRRSLYLATAYYWLQDYQKASSYFTNSVFNNKSAISEIGEIFNRKQNYMSPNPKTAMWLSVFLPGAGQFYSGDFTAGFNSLILTGSLVGLTFYLTKTYHPIDALLTALPWFQRYYQGGFEQAKTLAEFKLERKRKETYQEILRIIKESENFNR